MFGGFFGSRSAVFCAIFWCILEFSVVFWCFLEFFLSFRIFFADFFPLSFRDSHRPLSLHQTQQTPHFTKMTEGDGGPATDTARSEIAGGKRGRSGPWGPLTTPLPPGDFRTCASVAGPPSPSAIFQSARLLCLVEGERHYAVRGVRSYME